MIFASNSLKSSLEHWVTCTYKKLRSVLGLFQKFFWCAKGGNKQHIFQQHDFPFNVCKSVANTYLKEQWLLMDQDTGNPWIQSFYNTEDLSMITF